MLLLKSLDNIKGHYQCLENQQYVSSLNTVDYKLDTYQLQCSINTQIYSKSTKKRQQLTADAFCKLVYILFVLFFTV